MKSFRLLAAACLLLAAFSCKQESKKPVDELAGEQDLVAEIEQAYAAFADSLENAATYEEQVGIYIRYNRACRTFIATHPEALSQVLVLKQTMPGDETPVFQQPIDAIQFQSVYDRLVKLYPSSALVKELGEITEQRMSVLDLQRKIDDAKEVGFFDIALKDDSGQQIRLSEVESKVIMVYFWTCTDQIQLLFNRNILLPVYEKYHDRGFEIYSVSLDTDRAAWAKDVYEQKFPWIQVNDPAGPASVYVSYYNVVSLPWAAFICNGEIVPAQISDRASLEAFISRYL